MRILIAACCQKENRCPKLLLFPAVLGSRREVALSLGQLAALTPDGYQIDVVDEYYHGNIDFSKAYDLVAISSITLHVQRSYDVADEFRKRGIPVVLGGYHPSALPDEAIQHADAVVVGEAELTWPKLLKDFERGTMKSFYYQREPIDSKLIPPIKRGQELDFYCTGVQATRGCPHRCRFCSVQNIEGGDIRKRSVEYVINEIKSMSNNFFFADASLTIDPDYTKALFMELEKLNKHFECFGNINILSKDDELLRLSKNAGCNSWWIGFESVSQQSLDSVGKTSNRVEHYSAAIKKIRDYGITVKGLFVFGFDYDKLDIFDKTLNLLYEWDVDHAAFLILTPCPGTPLFNKLEKEGRILTKDWSKYDFGHVVFEPKNMSKDELWDGTRSIAKEFFSFSNIMRRIFVNNKDFYSFSSSIVSDFIIDRFFNKRDYFF